MVPKIGVTFGVLPGFQNASKAVVTLLSSSQVVVAQLFHFVKCGMAYVGNTLPERKGKKMATWPSGKKKSPLGLHVKQITTF